MASSSKRTSTGIKKKSSTKRLSLGNAAESPFVDNLFQARTKTEISFAATRGGGEAPRIKLKDHKPDDVVDLRLQGGLRLLTRLDDYLGDFPASRARGVADDEIILSGGLSNAEATRGVSDWIVEGLRIFGIDPIEAAAELTGEKVCKWYERKQLWKEDQKKPAEQRIWQIKTGDKLELAEPDFKLSPRDKPLLVFIHGTASSTLGSFSELWSTQLADLRKQLLSPYNAQVYGFEHYSLTESPIQNAIALVRELPANATLHLITHSRGGIVGELLCRGELDGRDPFTPDEIKRLFVDADGNPRANDQEQLKQLGDLLLQKRLRIARFVRVGCPARGTTLASERLDRWLSMLLNLFGDLSTLSASPFFQLFEEFATALVKTRTNPDKLPGLEAQMPSAPLIRLLNQRDINSRSDLHVVAGDIEGAGVWKRFGVFLTDLFYREDHDLVVNTSAMYGGAERAGGARRYFTQGPQVNHFSYFKNDASVKKLVSALHQPTENDGFEVFVPRQVAESRGYRGPSATRGAADASNKPIVFLLPGIMGSHLAVNGERIWLKPLALAAGGLEKLEISSSGVKADAPMESTYEKIHNHLNQFYDVVSFPFDWRRSLRAEAGRLASAIEDWLEVAEARNQPLSMLAHSMGGLLARVMIADQPKLWERICQHDRARLLMLGTPNGGSYSIPRMLVGKEGIIQGLALIDFKNSQAELLKLISKFPGVLEMLPGPDAGGMDFFAPGFWAELAGLQKAHWSPPGKTDLENARAVRKLLDKETPNPERLSYVAGCARETPMRLVKGSPPPDNIMIGFNRPNNSPDKFFFQSTPRGDGRVLWDTGILPNVKTWYMDATHGDMPANEDAFDAIVELLQIGKTDLLPTAQPVFDTRAVSAVRSMSDTIDTFPDDQKLEALAVGSTMSHRTRARKPKANVTIAHGNLAYASYPVAVGHYAGDTIVSAERALDRALNENLIRAHRLGLYPGPVNTAKIWLKPDGKPSGAIVIGLGSVGDLTPIQLSEGFARAMLAYAFECLQQKEILAQLCPQKVAGSETGPIEASVSALLIGSTAGGLPIRDALNAIMRGFARANRGLVEAKLDHRIVMSRLQFIELYEDRAILAAHTLKNLEHEQEIEEAFFIDTNVKTLPGGRRRAYFDEAPGWWQRIEISEEESGDLKFVVLTDRARAEVRLQPTQQALVDQFLADAIKDTHNKQDISSTLFELLIPNELKDHAPERRNTVLVLDDKAARYPWELMVDRLGPSRNFDKLDTGNDDRYGPLAVKAGIIRQLKALEFREKVISTSERTALVIGNPKVDDPRFVSLPGAVQEASAVAALLIKNNFDAALRNDASSNEIVRALFAKPYRILHLAGHGVYQFPIGEKDLKTGAQKLATGMVIGKNTLLTPVEVKQMRWVPDLVFINCCFSGMSKEEDARRDRHRLAANISTQLIEMGVRAVVAAGWEVDDDAAELFATIFYQRMLEGDPFGIAVLKAREKVYKTMPESNTWGAYQCYGDPDFSLDPKGRSSMNQEVTAPKSPFEATTRIENLAEDARVVSPSDAAWLRKKLDEIRKDLPASWLAAGALNAALGRAYGELDQFDEAVKHYAIALKASKADYALSTVEQLSNLEARWAVQQFKAAKQSDDAEAMEDAREIIDRALGRLEHLIALSPTSERLGLVGSAWKRASMVTYAPVEREIALEQMADYYRRAHKRAIEESGKASHYAVTNWITARALTATGPSKKMLNADVGTWMPGAERAAKEMDETDPNFWSGAAAADCRLALCLAQSSVGEHAQEIADMYLRAKQRAASPKDWRSIMEHIDFLQTIVGAKLPLADGLVKLRALLEKKSEQESDPAPAATPSKATARRK